MSNEELKAQFALCKTWQDAEQWRELAWAYWERGYEMNAAYCFRQSELCQKTMIVRTDLGMAGQCIELTLVPVATETE